MDGDEVHTRLSGDCLVVQMIDEVPTKNVRKLVLSDEGVTMADVYTVGGEVLMGTLRCEWEETDRRERRRDEQEEEVRRRRRGQSQYAGYGEEE